MGKITVEVKINTFGTMTHPNQVRSILCSLSKYIHLPLVVDDLSSVDLLE